MSVDVERSYMLPLSLTVEPEDRSASFQFFPTTPVLTVNVEEHTAHHCLPRSFFFFTYDMCPNRGSQKVAGWHTTA